MVSSSARNIFNVHWVIGWRVDGSITVKPWLHEWCIANLRGGRAGYEVDVFRFRDDNRFWRLGLTVHDEEDALLFLTRWAGELNALTDIGPYTDDEMRRPFE